MSATIFNNQKVQVIRDYTQASLVMREDVLYTTILG